MATNLFNNLIRIGKVSSRNEKTCTVRVTFEDKDDVVSYDLPILTRGSQTVKDYWLPDVNEQVLCVFLPNSKNLTEGFVLGSFFSTTDAPSTTSGGIRCLDFGDGTTISYNRGTKALMINCAGEVIINGSNVRIN